MRLFSTCKVKFSISSELCSTCAHVVCRLLCEVQELYNTIRQLKETLHESELTMSRMVKVRTLLLHDIAVKENTLQIDQRCVIGRRRFMPMDPAVGPIVSLEPCPHPCS